MEEKKVEEKTVKERVIEELVEQYVEVRATLEEMESAINEVILAKQAYTESKLENLNFLLKLLGEENNETFSKEFKTVEFYIETILEKNGKSFQDYGILIDTCGRRIKE